MELPWSPQRVLQSVNCSRPTYATGLPFTSAGLKLQDLKAFSTYVQLTDERAQVHPMSGALFHFVRRVSNYVAHCRSQKLAGKVAGEPGRNSLRKRRPNRRRQQHWDEQS